MAPQLASNYRPLSPLLFLERASNVFREKTAIVHKQTQRNYREFAGRCYRLASALKQAGIGKGDAVAFLCPNTPPMLEAHYGVPLAGAILVTINIRLATREVEYILNHSGAKALFIDSEYAHIVEPLLGKIPALKTIVNIIDNQDGAPIEGAAEYEKFVAGGSSHPISIPIEDENEPISINYTSGTTGNPKGVVYTHRSVYLNCLGVGLEAALSSETRYLWTVPMFHCNGWCFTWSVTMVGGSHVCLRKIDPGEIFRLIQAERVSIFCAAPTVLISLYSHPDANPATIDWPIKVFTGGAPPSPTVIRNVENLNMQINHIYGLTETYGPYTICEWQPQFDIQGEDYRCRMKARQGVPHISAHEVRVVNDQMEDVAPDGTEAGEIVMRGNIVMQGYYNDPEATEKAFRGGWFHSGDTAVMHSDGYIEIRDRSKDIIISGGENISSIEVENVLYRHPDVQEAAVIAIPDEKWGEVVKAFVVLKPGSAPTEEEIINFCREQMAHFKCPRRIHFGELPKTSTGKIKKYVLREREWAGMEKRVH